MESSKWKQKVRRSEATVNKKMSAWVVWSDVFVCVHMIQEKNEEESKTEIKIE